MINQRILCTFSIVITLTCAVSAHEWKAWGNLREPRAFGYAAAISSTSAIVFGGLPDFVASSQKFGSRVLNTCEILDAKTGAVRATMSTAVGHADGPVVTMSNGKVVVLGGLTGDKGKTTTLVEEFDPASETWTTKGNLLYSRRQQEAIAIDDHRIMVVCGRGSDLAGTKTAEIFDLTTGQSTAIAEYRYQLTNHKLMMVDSNVYVVGGREGGPNDPRSRNIYFYDEQTNRWVFSFELPVQMPLIEGVQVYGGMFTSGGSVDMGDSQFSDIVYYINGTSATPLSGRLETSVKGHSMVPWINDSLIAFGGEGNSGMSAKESSWINTVTGVVSLGPELISGRRYGMEVQLQGDQTTPACIFAIGGVTGSSTTTRSVEILTSVLCSQSSSSSLLNASSVKTVGAATLTSSSSVLLTGTNEYSTGAVWYNRKVSIRSGLSTSFSFRFLQGSDKAQPDGGPQGADGLALVIQNGSPSPLGAAGQGIGYEDIPNAIAVEFDAYLNASYSDPAASHVAIQSQRDKKLKPWHRSGFTIGLSTNVPPLRSDGTIYYARVDFNSTGVEVYLDTVPALNNPALSILGISVPNLISLGLDNAAYIGITSATGFSVQEHELLAWTLQGCDVVSVGVADTDDFFEQTNSLSIIPSPSTDLALLRWRDAQSAATINIYDVTGNHIRSLNASNDELVRGVRLPSFDLAPGIYVAQLVTPSMVRTVRWMIQK